MGSVRVAKGQRDLRAALLGSSARERRWQSRSLNKAPWEEQGNDGTLICTSLPRKRPSDRVLRTGGEILVSRIRTLVMGSGSMVESKFTAPGVSRPKALLCSISYCLCSPQDLL